MSRLMFAPLLYTSKLSAEIERRNLLYKQQWVTTTITDMMCISRALTLVHP